MRISDWSSDVCSSDLVVVQHQHLVEVRLFRFRLGLGRDAQFGAVVAGIAALRHGFHLWREVTETKICHCRARHCSMIWYCRGSRQDRRSEEHTSELQSLMRISYAVFCLKKKNNNTPHTQRH